MIRCHQNKLFKSGKDKCMFLWALFCLFLALCFVHTITRDSCEHWFPPSGRLIIVAENLISVCCDQWLRDLSIKGTWPYNLAYCRCLLLWFNLNLLKSILTLQAFCFASAVSATLLKTKVFFSVSPILLILQSWFLDV